MTKKERVRAVLNGKKPDCCPVTFSLHFDENCASGVGAAEKHFEFFEKTGTDIFKIMNENLFARVDEIKNPADWKNIPVYSLKDRFMQEQLDLIKRILDRCGSDGFTLATIHGVFVSALHPLKWVMPGSPSRKLLCAHVRENRAPVVDALKRVADGLCLLVRATAELGVDGVYYAALGGEKHFLTDNEYAELIEPLDKQVLSAATEAGASTFLHICKEGLNMNRFAPYAPYCDVVNWGVYEAPYSIEDGKNLFPDAVICGGLSNRIGLLFDGTTEELASSIRDLSKTIGANRFILGADCTLPSDTDWQRINFVSDVAHSCRC